MGGDLSNVKLMQTQSYKVPMASLGYAQAKFRINVALGASTQVAVTYSVSCASKIVTVTFSRAVVNSVPLVTIGNYTIVPPAGSPTPTILSATVSSPTTVSLLLDDCLNGGVYHLTVGVGTCVATDDGGTNAAVSTAFTGGGASAPAIAASFATGPNTLRVVFTKAVRQVSGGNADDALNLANYVVTDDVTTLVLPISAVVGKAPTVVDITTSTQVAKRKYTVVDSNIKDLAGNVVA